MERQPVRRTGDFEVLTPAEVEALARAAESEQDAATFITAAFTGLRMGELRALRWRDLDFSKWLVHVRRGFTRWELGDTKSHKVRSVPMIDQVLAALDRLSRREFHVAEDDLVFPNSVGNFLDDSKLRRRFHKALERAGLKQIRFHDLRHTFGTLAVQAFPLGREGLHGPRRHPDDDDLRPSRASARRSGTALADGGGLGRLPRLIDNLEREAA